MYYYRMYAVAVRSHVSPSAASNVECGYVAVILLPVHIHTYMRHTLAQQETTAVAVALWNVRVGVQVDGRASPRLMHDVRSKTDGFSTATITSHDHEQEICSTTDIRHHWSIVAIRHYSGG